MTYYGGPSRSAEMYLVQYAQLFSSEKMKACVMDGLQHRYDQSLIGVVPNAVFLMNDYQSSSS